MTGSVARSYPTIPLKAIDEVAIADQEQALYEVRKKIYPRAVHGVFARWRVALVIVTSSFSTDYRGLHGTIGRRCCSISARASFMSSV